MFGSTPLSGKQISVGKVSSSVYSNVNGHKASHGEVKEQVNKNGKLFAKVSGKVDVTQEGNSEPKSKSKIEVDVPSKGIHKTLVKDGWNREVIDGQDFSNNGQRRSDSAAENGIEKLNAYSGLEFTPLDVAEYIFWTGDEKGVILAIEEGLEKGLMSREEAIRFLQSIKTNLDYMQEHYHGLQRTENRIANNDRSSIRERLSDADKPSSFDYDVPQESENLKSDSYDDSRYEPVLKDPYERQAKVPLNTYEAPMKVKSYGPFADRTKRYREEAKTGSNGITLTDEDFEELLERLRVADFLYNEYSLEEVIYQLAKVVFSQSLARGSSDAQLALQRFTTFLEKEARLGQISRSLEKKIIDLLIAALSDTLAENPELLSEVRENLNEVEVQNLSSPRMLKSQSQNIMDSSPAGNRNLGKTSSKSSKASTSKN